MFNDSGSQNDLFHQDREAIVAGPQLNHRRYAALGAWLSALACSFLLTPRPVAAQWWGSPYYGGYTASTPAEGYARGMADITRSAGMANLLNAQAAGAAEQARSIALDNDLKATETYFNKKAVNRAYKEATKKPPLSSDQLAAIARSREPKALESNDFDPVTGDIVWPSVLREPRYQQYRVELENFFHQRAKGAGDPAQLQAACDGLTSALKANIRKYPSSDYLRARNFVTSLSYEGSR